MTDISLRREGIIVAGRYFVMQENFPKAQEGEFSIAWRDLLSVDVVASRSKKLMLSAVGASVAISAVTSTIASAVLGEAAAYVIAAALLLGAGVCLLGYFFSRRHYLELSFFGGVIRVMLEKTEAEEYSRLAKEKINSRL